MDVLGFASHRGGAFRVNEEEKEGRNEPWPGDQGPRCFNFNLIYCSYVYMRVNTVVTTAHNILFFKLSKTNESS